jgi:hypothetical protein
MIKKKRMRLAGHVTHIKEDNSEKDRRTGKIWLKIGTGEWLF